MLLVDTSVWIEVFRRDTTFHLESVADFEEVSPISSALRFVIGDSTMPPDYCPVSVSP